MVEDIKTIEQDIPEAKEVIEEIKSADEDTLKETINKWYEKTRTDGMRLGAKYISLGVYAAIRKHTSKPGKVSLRDYQRCINEINKLIEVQLGLKKQNENTTEETKTEEAE